MCLRKAVALIAKHDMGNNFRPHIAHRHDFLDQGTVRFETKIIDTPYMLTIPTDISNVDFVNIHATCFKVIGNDLVAFEFAEGPTPLDASKVPPQFIWEWIEFINRYDLTNQFTLDFGSFGKGDEPTTEIEVQIGNTSATITVPILACNRECSTNIPTSWMVSAPYIRDPARDSSPATPAPGTHWNQSTKPGGVVTHKVHVNSLSSPSGKELVDALVKLHVIKGALF